MAYRISEKELETLTLFVPNWFIDAIISGTQEDELKTLIKENLVSAYQIAKREWKNDQEIQEKINDLYEVYTESLKEYQVNKSSDE